MINNLNKTNMTNFVFIVNCFPPVNNQNSLRALELSKRLIKENINPIILTRRVERREKKDFSLIKEIPKKIEIYKTPIIELKKRFSLRTLFFKITKKIFYIYTFIHWVPFGYLCGKQILKKKKNVKFIYATGPPYYAHMIGYLLKRKYNLPLILEYRDPWSFNPYQAGKKLDLYKSVNLRVEKLILKSADMIITISEPLKDFLKLHFPEIKGKPIYSIENGLNLRNEHHMQRKENEKIIFTFIGHLYPGRDIDGLLKIVSDLKTKGILQKINFLFKIFGKYNRKYLEKIINRLNIKDLVFLGDYLTRKQISEETNECYLAIHIGEDLNYPTISFKVWDYLSCRKKIIYLGREDSFTADFLKENNFGLTLPVNDLNKGRERLEKLFIDIRKNEYINYIDRENIERFSWDNLVNRLILTFKNI